MPSLFAAFDTDFVLALEAGSGACKSALDILGQSGFHFLVSPVVEESLYWLSWGAQHEETKQTAADCLVHFAVHGLLPASPSGMDLLLTRNTAEIWLKASLCTGATINDYLIVTEAAQLGARVLVTSRKAIIEGKKKLQVALINAHLPVISILDLGKFGRLS
jgi:hypothetical protein